MHVLIYIVLQYMLPKALRDTVDSAEIDGELVRRTIFVDQFLITKTDQFLCVWQKPHALNLP